MKNATNLSTKGRLARDGFCRCGSGASSGASSNCSGTEHASINGGGGSGGGSFDLAATAKRASVNKLARLLGEEVRCDDRVLFQHSPASQRRRNAFANIFCGLPSKGLRRLFAIYGIDEVQTKAPSEPLDLAEEARLARQEAKRRGGEAAAAAVAAAAIASATGHHQSRSHQQQQQQLLSLRHHQHHHHQHRPHSAMDPARRRLQLPAFAAA